MFHFPLIMLGWTSAAWCTSVRILYKMQQYTNYSFVFDFEKNFDPEFRLKWVQDRSYLPFYTIAIYLVAIFTLKSFMKNKTAFNLRKPLIAWNAFIAVANIMGCTRGVPVLLFDLDVYGFHFSVCNNGNGSNVSFCWGWIAVVFKYLELFDTLFIVLRKRKLIFLHWYHHATVLICAWFTYADMAAPGRWMATMNAVVHAFMYTYYTATSMEIKIPRWVAMFVTTLQIIQMLIGSYISIYIYILRKNGSSCAISNYVSNYLVAMYFSYFLLFVNYFYKTYIKVRPVVHKKIN